MISRISLSSSTTIIRFGIYSTYPSKQYAFSPIIMIQISNEKYNFFVTLVTPFAIFDSQAFCNSLGFFM
ncbi:hypothetical protein ccbrp13_59890 [Ktedonobacteria bacterium brp13]|nr:hypothetical protein ccbrp13_59890 [Ktedonobacteria bacterium brp13]